MSNEPHNTPHIGPRIARRGLLLVLSSPSGAGKTTLARALLDSDKGIHLSVSVTTRPSRPGEVGGRDYHFIDQAEFDRLRESGELLEWARVFDNSYGTPRAAVERAISEGHDVLFDIDWQGAQQLSEKLAGDLVRVFVLPPSGDVLERRLHTRAQDPKHVVDARMSKAAAEISHWPEYDYVIVNTHLEESIAGLRAILTAERLKRERLLGLSDFVRDLQSRL
ncbi:MAG: guanylate kinase [Hyphomicrobiaceae bacterium]|nr:guanylate kinase [Hyphomicrobiaceae bacterium]